MVYHVSHKQHPYLNDHNGNRNKPIQRAQLIKYTVASANDISSLLILQNKRFFCIALLYYVYKYHVLLLIHLPKSLIP